MSKVSISVVMPAFNAEKYLAKSIDSILAQTFTNFEFIIINDGSTDNSSKIIKKYACLDSRIVVADLKENKGIVHALNHGISLAKGKYIARMDSDDIAMPKRLEIQYHFLEKNKECAVLGTYAHIFFFGDTKLKIRRKLYTEYDYLKVFTLFRCPFVHPTTMVRKSVLKLAPYSEYAPKAEDYQLWTELIFTHNCQNLPQYLLQYRVHKNQLSQTTGNAECLRKIYENMFKQLSISFSEEQLQTHISIQSNEYKNLSVKELIEIDQWMQCLYQQLIDHPSEFAPKALDIVFRNIWRYACHKARTNGIETHKILRTGKFYSKQSKSSRLYDYANYILLSPIYRLKRVFM